MVDDPLYRCPAVSVVVLRLVLISDPSRVTDTEVALVDDHVIVTDPPAVGLVLLAEILATTLL